jgi:hypothetical protein
MDFAQAGSVHPMRSKIFRVMRDLNQMLHPKGDNTNVVTAIG